tara:strand:- start:23 stop:301 length:279 start_codon:yes stop_codon:yes gene_type:complete
LFFIHGLYPGLQKQKPLFLEVSCSEEWAFCDGIQGESALVRLPDWEKRALFDRSRDHVDWCRLSAVYGLLEETIKDFIRSGALEPTLQRVCR